MRSHYSKHMSTSLAAVCLVLAACHDNSSAARAPHRSPEARDEKSRTVDAVTTRSTTVLTQPSHQVTDNVPIDDYSTPRAAMDAFIQALRRKDVDAFLLAFSPHHDFDLISTAEVPHKHLRVTTKALREGMLPGGDYLDLLFEGDDNLRDYTLSKGGGDKPWLLQAPTTFVPPLEQALPVYVRWAKYGAQYAIAEIAFPH
jgi:hypothetical protein